MRVSQRQVVRALLVVLSAGSLLALVYQLFVPSSTTSLASTATGVLVLSALLLAYWRGWEPARYITLVFITILIGLSPSGPFVSERFTLAAFIPPILALIVAGPGWILGSAAAVIGLLILRSGGQGVYVDPLSLLLYAMPICGLLLGRLVTDTAQQDSEANADQARQALAHSKAQATELAQTAEELSAQNEQQRRLLDLVATLETPAVSLADGVLLAPVVGHLDSRRADELTRRLLDEVSAQRTRMVILDIAGVPTVDTAVAQALLRAIQAIRLLGCEVTVTGISASVAATMTQLGINMAGVRTARTPQEAMTNDTLRAERPQANGRNN
jgi:rsbT co-antagonist protein RsbR